MGRTLLGGSFPVCLMITHGFAHIGGLCGAGQSEMASATGLVMASGWAFSPPGGQLRDLYVVVSEQQEGERGHSKGCGALSEKVCKPLLLHSACPCKSPGVEKEILLLQKRSCKACVIVLNPEIHLN